MGYKVTCALTTMAEKDNRAVVQLFEMMSSEGEHLHRFAAFGLRRLKHAAVPYLIRGLKSGNAKLRWRCAWALGGMKSTYAAPAIPYLRACEKDGNKEVRKWATWALECIETRFFDHYPD
jgi:HEAT repeat protein